MQFLLFELADDSYLKIALKEFCLQQSCEIISGGDQKSNNRATDYYSIFVCDAQFITYLNRNSNRFHDIETPSGPRNQFKQFQTHLDHQQSYLEVT